MSGHRRDLDVHPVARLAAVLRMTIDAMDLLYFWRITGFGLMSSDSDFGPIAMRLKQDGLPVYGFGTDKAPESFREACTRYIDVSKLPTDAGAGADAGPMPVDAELIALLTDAWKASKRDEWGFASLSEVGNRAGNQSSFDARNYGVARLSDLVAKIPEFQLERRDNLAFVKPVRWRWQGAAHFGAAPVPVGVQVRPRRWAIRGGGGPLRPRSRSP